VSVPFFLRVRCLRVATLHHLSAQRTLCPSTTLLSSTILNGTIIRSHGVGQVESSEPSYVTATIFKDRASFENWAKTANTDINAEQSRSPEKVYYEGTLVINSGKYM